MGKGPEEGKMQSVCVWWGLLAGPRGWGRVQVTWAWRGGHGSPLGASLGFGSDGG